MADDNERRAAKRSRFDQTVRTGRTEDPGPRSSRFDRRSRSPPAKGGSHGGRDRSPLGREGFSPGGGDRKKSGIDPAAAAAAAAAKINAQIQAKKGIQHVDVPPIRSAGSPTDKASSPTAAGGVNGEIYIADGDYIKDIEVNDLRNRYTLTKGSTQKMIKEETGADVTTRGNYYPDKSMATPANPPLYLHVTSTSKDGLERAVAKIEELMQQELPNLVDERRFRRREPDQVERDEFGRRKWPEERIAIDLDPVPGFNLRAQVVGHGGAYVKHIQQETRCRVQIKGRGSGFMENATGHEADEPMYLHVAGPDPKEVQNAKELCEDLIANVKEQYQRFKDNPPPQHHNHHNSHNQNYNGPNHHNNQPQNYPPQRQPSYSSTGYGAGYGNNSGPGGYGSASSPPPGTPGTGAPGGAGIPANTDYAAQYQQYYGNGAAPGQADPYAAYGGYAAYCQYYAYYQQQAAQQASAAQPASGPGAGSPPPPPSGGPPGTEGGAASAPPPPPPPSGSPPGTSGGGYNSVPPPPGM